MVLESRHIDYLLLVRDGKVQIKRPTFKKDLKFMCSDPEPLNQTVAIQMHILGATRIVWSRGHQIVQLTLRGEHILIEEDEAWG